MLPFALFVCLLLLLLVIIVVVDSIWEFSISFLLKASLNQTHFLFYKRTGLLFFLAGFSFFFFVLLLQCCVDFR